MTWKRKEKSLRMTVEKQKAIDAQKNVIMDILNSGDSDKLANSAISSQSEEESANQSRSLLDNGDGESTIVMDKGGEQRDDLSQQIDEIPAEQSSELITQPDTNEIVREIQEELVAKTRSLCLFFRLMLLTYFCC